MPTSGSAGIPEPLPVDVDDSTPVEVNVQEPVSVDDNGGSLTVDGTVDLGNQFDDEYEVLCDSTPTTFIRRYRTDSAGVVTVTNLTLAGAPFAPVGAVAKCVQTISDGGGSITVDGTVTITDGSGPVTVDGSVALTNQFDDEYQLLCDTVTSFLRRLRTDSAGVVTVANFTLAGGAYVPVGAVSPCSTTVGNFRDDEYVVLCDTVTSFLRRFRSDAAGAVTVTDLTLAGAAYVPVGAVALCATSATITNRRDLFAEILCDTVTNFLRRYTVNDAGVVTITNTTLDGTTAYVPVGPIVACAAGGAGGDDYEIVELCDAIPQQELWGIQQDGANYDLIETNPLDGSTTVLLNNFTTENVNCLAWVPERRRLYGRTQSGAGANNVWEIDPYAPSAAVIGTVTGLPAGTWIFGAYDPHTDRWIIGGNSLALYGIDLNTLAAERASTFTLPAGGSGDIAFDECGRLYVSSDGVITRYNSLFDGSPTTIATVPNNGSGFGGAGYWKDGFFIGTFGNGEVFSVNTSTGQITTGLGPIGGGTLIDFAADPRNVVHFPFHRVWDLTNGTFTDTNADGDPYTVEGLATVGLCPTCCNCGEPGDRPFGNPVAVTVSLVPSGGSLVSSASARRVTAIYQVQPAAARDTINGVALPDTGTDTTIVLGDLAAPGHVPPTTFATAAASGRNITVIQEF